MLYSMVGVMTCYNRILSAVVLGLDVNIETNPVVDQSCDGQAIHDVDLWLYFRPWLTHL